MEFILSGSPLSTVCSVLRFYV